MYKRIMVPLDGSELAECVLPHVESAVRGCNIPDVLFVRAVEPVLLSVGVTSDFGTVYTEVDAKKDREKIDQHNKDEAKTYLDDMIKRQKYENANLKAVVLFGKAAENLAEYAGKNAVDLIIIATHGRSGISRWLWGSTADRILRSSCVPVLMVRAPGCVPGI
jgi:nucleotide-binding universal stress UspA family protein